MTGFPTAIGTMSAKSLPMGERMLTGIQQAPMYLQKRIAEDAPCGAIRPHVPKSSA